MEFNQVAIPLVIGFILDSILGDPLWLPHPIRWFGNIISFFEKKYNSGSYKKIKGAIISIFLISNTFLFFYYLIEITKFNMCVYYSFSSMFVFYGLANRSLITESLKVEKKLENEGVEAGRKQVSCIVGRDTSELTENKIRIAVLETLSENLSDGVIAPVFYFAIGGVPLMLTYKMVNTLDSMIGYKNNRYRKFGYFAAKLDDIFNYIPARVTSFIMVVITFSKKGFEYIFKYGNKHASPNAGYPEAALAGILNCQFGGSNKYHGIRIDKPLIGDNDRVILKNDIYKVTLINYFTSLVFLFLILLIFACFL